MFFAFKRKQEDLQHSITKALEERACSKTEKTWQEHRWGLFAGMVFPISLTYIPHVSNGLVLIIQNATANQPEPRVCPLHWWFNEAHETAPKTWNNCGKSNCPGGQPGQHVVPGSIHVTQFAFTFALLGFFFTYILLCTSQHHMKHLTLANWNMITKPNWKAEAVTFYVFDLAVTAKHTRCTPIHNDAH